MTFSDESKEFIDDHKCDPGMYSSHTAADSTSFVSSVCEVQVSANAKIRLAEIQRMIHLQFNESIPESLAS